MIMNRVTGIYIGEGQAYNILFNPEFNTTIRYSPASLNFWNDI